jgi:putative nucleotidyltransferase with HDIG domain
MNTLLHDQQLANVLLVDDEQAVLNSLRRTLRSKPYNLFTATSGEDGIKIIENQKIDLVISDMRMPGMSGAEFLSKVSHSNPLTSRIILTGYADMDATVQAINEAQIVAYITKPWKKDALQQTIEMALYTQKLEYEKQELLELTRTQNDELREFNIGLEDRVARRTQELKRANGQLNKAYEDLEENYSTAIEVFCRMMALRDREHAGHCKRVAQLAKNTAKEMRLSTPEVRNIYYAGLLHDIGKTHFPGSLISKPLNSLSLDEREIYVRHVTHGEALLTPLDSCHPISHLVRHHHERYDGKGFPDRLERDDIPQGAAILAVAEDFDEACTGLIFNEPLSLNEARQMILDRSGSYYHPDIVHAFISALDKNGECISPHGSNRVTTEHLQPDMVLEKDLIRSDGVLLLKADTTLKAAHIKKIRQIEYDHRENLILWIVEESNPKPQKSCSQ